MLSSLEELSLHDSEWAQLQARLQAAASIGGIVLAAWQIGMWVARTVVHEDRRLPKTVGKPGNSFNLCPSRPLSSFGTVTHAKAETIYT